MNDTTNPMASTTHWSGVICETPIGFSPLPRSDFSNVYPVATIMVGMERKSENSSAEARDIPASCPAAMVDIERDVPGNTADKIWHAPIQIDCPRLMSSTCQVGIGLFEAPCPAFSQGAVI